MKAQLSCDLQNLENDLEFTVSGNSEGHEILIWISCFQMNNNVHAFHKGGQQRWLPPNRWIWKMKKKLFKCITPANYRSGWEWHGKGLSGIRRISERLSCLMLPGAVTRSSWKQNMSALLQNHCNNSICFIIKDNWILDCYSSPAATSGK